MTLNYFDRTGRRIPTDEMRVFGLNPRNYYRFQQPVSDLKVILERSKKQGIVSNDFTLNEFKAAVNNITDKINQNKLFKNILNGICIPFVCQRAHVGVDLGAELVDNLLPKLKNAFAAQFPDAEFKAVLQNDSKLHGNVKLHPDARYEEFIDAVEERATVGLYFPQVLQEFDVNSQRLQMRSLPRIEGIKMCLSGGLDMCAALVGSTEILFSEDFYTPIPIMSAYVHHDSRMILMVKAYGPHLEFWCMSQMMTKKITQVSEQWTGGLTIYS